MESGDGEDLEARLAARRERAVERLAQEGGTAVAEPLSSVSAEEASVSERQVEASRKILEARLAKHATALASAKLAAEAHDVAQRRERAQRTARLLQLDSAQAEASSSVANDKRLTAGFAALQGVQEPQELHAQLAAQSQTVKNAQASKDAMLNELTRDVSVSDELYEKELGMQAHETQSSLHVSNAQFLELQAAFIEETRSVDASVVQEHAELVAAQEAEIAALLEQRASMERDIVVAVAQRSISNAEAVQTLRARCMEDCNALVAELDSKQLALEQRLASIHGEHVLAADSLRIRERSLTEKDAENSAAAQQLKRKIAAQRGTLQASKDTWSTEEKTLRDEQARLAGDHARGSLQFRLLDAKHEVLETADGRRRMGAEETDTEMLDELCESCDEAALRLQHLARLPVDGIAPSEELLAEVAAAVAGLSSNADTADAESTMRLLESLSAAISSQRGVLDARAATLSELATLRKALAAM